MLTVPYQSLASGVVCSIPSTFVVHVFHRRIRRKSPIMSLLFPSTVTCILISPPLTMQTQHLRASYEGGVNLAVANCPTEERIIGSFEGWKHEDTGPGKTASVPPTPTPVDRETLGCITRCTCGAKVTNVTCAKYTIGCMYH